MRGYPARYISHMLHTEASSIGFSGEFSLIAALHQRHRGRTVRDGKQRVPARDAEHHLVAALVGKSPAARLWQKT